MAVELLDGRVLVAGGTIGIPLNSAEIYDPTTGTWSPTGSLSVDHSSACALRLQDGKVLLMGGMSGISENTSVAELYDPATGAWTVTDPMITAREGFTATMLMDGRVLVAGGFNPTLKACEIYDPNTGHWSATGQLTHFRGAHQAVLLPNGQVLVVGGLGGDSQVGGAPIRVTEVYDQVTGSWRNAGRLLAGRYFASTNLLPNGQILVAGGLVNEATGVTRRCELGTLVNAPAAP